MFYHWLAPLGKQYIIFNLFNYISFRAAGATVTALLLAFVLGPSVIRRLRARKVGQVIRAEGPASHQTKRGTPTMGGLIILFATIVPTLLWAPLTNRFVVVAMLSTLWMGCIGFLDDYLKIVQGKSRGLVARWKLAGQVQLRAPARALSGLQPCRSGETPPRHRYDSPVLQVPGGQLRALAVRGVRHGGHHRGEQRGQSDGRAGRAGHRVWRVSPRRHLPCLRISSAG